MLLFTSTYAGADAEGVAEVVQRLFEEGSKKVRERQRYFAAVLQSSRYML